MILGNNSTENLNSGRDDERKKLAERVNLVYHAVMNAENYGAIHIGVPEVQAQPQLESVIEEIRTELEPNTHEFDLYPETAADSMQTLADEARILLAEARGEENA